MFCILMPPVSFLLRERAARFCVLFWFPFICMSHVFICFLPFSPTILPTSLPFCHPLPSHSCWLLLCLPCPDTPCYFILPHSPCYLYHGKTLAFHACFVFITPRGGCLEHFDSTPAFPFPLYYLLLVGRVLDIWPFVLFEKDWDFEREEVGQGVGLLEGRGRDRTGQGQGRTNMRWGRVGILVGGDIRHSFVSFIHFVSDLAPFLFTGAGWCCHFLFGFCFLTGTYSPKTDTLPHALLCLVQLKFLAPLSCDRQQRMGHGVHIPALPASTWRFGWTGLLIVLSPSKPKAASSG